jgi:hypothetical protein
VNLLLLADPDVPDGPDLRILEGNLQLRMSNFYLASDTFLEGARRSNHSPPVESGDRPVADRSGVLRHADRQEPGQVRHRRVVPAAAAKWVKAEPKSRG